MTKEKWILIILGVIDLILVTVHYSDYVLLFLKPTGYIIPLIINLVIIVVIILRSKLPKAWRISVTIAILFIDIPVILFHSFIVWFQDYSYTEINAPDAQQSLVIEYRHTTLGETTYFYHFYKTKFGFVGKHLDNQSITMIIRDYPSGIDAEGVLGLGEEEWITTNTVRFSTWQGIKDVYLSSSQSAFKSEELGELIEKFMKKAKNKENGQTITINGNLLTISYDEATGQEWIEIANEGGEGAIPTQQCSRIVPNEERGYYMLEECTHQSEYPLYPMEEKR